MNPNEQPGAPTNPTPTTPPTPSTPGGSVTPQQPPATPDQVPQQPMSGTPPTSAMPGGDQMPPLPTDKQMPAKPVNKTKTGMLLLIAVVVALAAVVWLMVQAF